jgi:hypothetical protein
MEEQHLAKLLNEGWQMTGVGDIHSFILVRERQE